MITAILPIKTNSERLKNKNFLDFCGKPLYQVILDCLNDIDIIDKIIINTDNEIIKIESPKRSSKVIIHNRPSHLLGDHITMNYIIEYDLSLLNDEHFLQTHVTNPLLTQKTIQEAIDTYFKKLQTNDSLFTVEKIKKRGYDPLGKPINHSNEILLQTQDLPEINIENSNLFIFSRSSFFNAKKSRIGVCPQLFQMSSIEGIDIDYDEDFKLAKLVYQNKASFGL